MTKEEVKETEAYKYWSTIFELENLDMKIIINLQKAFIEGASLMYAIADAKALEAQELNTARNN